MGSFRKRVAISANAFLPVDSSLNAKPLVDVGRLAKTCFAGLRVAPF